MLEKAGALRRILFIHLIHSEDGEELTSQSLDTVPHITFLEVLVLLLVAINQTLSVRNLAFKEIYRLSENVTGTWYQHKFITNKLNLLRK